MSREKLRGQFGKMDVVAETDGIVGGPHIDLNGSATGTVRLSPDEARRVARWVRNAPQAAEQLLVDDDLNGLADDIEEAAERVSEELSR